MTKCHLLVVALCVAAGFLSAAEANVHPNEGFGTPIYGKKHINETQHFYHEDGKEPSTIKYDVEHHDDVVHFRLPQYGVRHASCSEEKMVVKFATHESMVEFLELLGTDNNKILAGGCLDMDTLDVVGACSKVLSVKARKDLSADSRTIFLKVRPADWEEVFVHAKVTANFQPGFAEEYRKFKGKSRRLIGDWGIGDKDECTEHDPDCNPEFGKTWNVQGFSKSYNGKQLVQWGPVDVTCEQCEVDFSPSLTFGLHVKYLKLKHVKLSAEGDLSATVKFKASAHAQVEKSGSKLIHTFKAPPIVFSIGVVPIKLEFSAPVTAGYKAQFEGIATATAGMTGSVRVVGGVEYENGQFKRIGEFSPTFSALTPTASANGTFHAEVSLGAKVELDINNIARGSIEPVTTLAFDGSLSGSGSFNWGWGGSASASATLKGKLSSRVRATIGGELGVRIKNKNIGPRKSLLEKEVLNTGRTLWSGTITKSASHSFDEMEDDDDDLVVKEKFYDDVEPFTKVVDDASGLAKSIPEYARTDKGWQTDMESDE